MGDLDYTTSNKIVINGIYELPAINCKGQSADKIPFIERHHYISAIKKSFGNKVGGVTNYGSSCYDKISIFKENSDEYKEIDYRMKCIQFYQQECIDSAKNGIPPKPIPSYWHDFRDGRLKHDIDKETGEVKETDEEFNEIELLNNVLVEKKPYFFRYIYDKVNKDYASFKNKTESNCARRFRCKVDDLKAKEHLNQEQEDFLKWYEVKNTLSSNPCIVNKLAWLIEENFDNLGRVENVPFDSNIYINDDIDIAVSSSATKSIKAICESYKKSMQAQYNNVDFNDKTDVQKVKEDAVNKLSDELATIMPNERQLANVLVNLAYTKGTVPKFIAWLISGEIILENMLDKKDRKITFPVKSGQGNILYGGNLFTMVEKQIIKREVV